MADASAAAPWFISYGGADREAARAIDRFLRENGVQTFFDRRSLRAGERWFDELDAALSAAAGALILIGAKDLGSVQKMELHVAMSLQAKRGSTNGRSRFRVIPVLLGGVESDRVPGFVAINTWVEVRDTAYPTELLEALRPGVGGVDRAAKAPVCPFRALDSFREEDASLYFGREVEAAALYDLVTRQTFVAVVGPSGTGKSSLVQAGLLPRLRAARPPEPIWHIASFAPGRRPFYNAASALSLLWLGDEADAAKRASTAGDMERQLLDGHVQLSNYVHEALKDLPKRGRLLLVVDQFEELFTYDTNTADLRTRFLDALFACVDDEACQVVFTLRGDYYGRAIELGRRMTEVLQHAQLSVGAVAPEGLEDVITGPSTRAGLRIDQGLVDLILRDVARQEGPLPLLQFTLTLLWKRGHGQSLSLSDYKDIDGVKGAIETSADATLASLSESQRNTARYALTRLVRVSTTNEEGANARQRVALGDLSPEEQAVVSAFARARLIVLSKEDDGAAIAEVAHEALIRSWKTFAGWIESEFHFLVWRQRLAFSVSEWELAKGEATTLLAGSRLEEAQRWQRSHGQGLSSTERAFVDASVRQARGARAWRWAAAAIAIAAGLGALGYYRWRHSDASVVADTIATASVRDAAGESRGIDDPYIENLQAWIAALVATGREGMALAAAADAMSQEACVKASAAAYVRSREANLTRTTLPELDDLVRRIDGDAVMCASRLPLTDDERARVGSMAQSVADREAIPGAGNEHSVLRDAVYAAAAAKTVTPGAPAAQVARRALDRILASSVQGKSELLAMAASRVGSELSAADRTRLLAGVDRSQPYYLRRCRAALEDGAIAPADFDAFLLRTAAIDDGSRPPTVPGDALFDTDVAREAGRVLAGLVHRGHSDAVLGILDRVLPPLEDGTYSRHSAVTILVSVADALLDKGRQGDALRVAGRALPQVGSIPSPRYRSRASCNLARVYARTGRVRQAKALADQSRDGIDRLGAYAAIVKGCDTCGS